MRKAHQMPRGYQISKSKTVPVSTASAYKAWSEKRSRDQWLGETITVRKSTPKKSIRFNWSDDNTSIEVDFYDKDTEKCQVVVQHSKLPTAAKAERMKKYWGVKLEAYKSYLT